MKIRKIRIKNFKSIVNLEIECNSDFNVIIGQNNIGKTTILEAILLWKICFDKNIQVSGEKFYSKAKNLRFEELSFLRITDDIDLFNEVKNKKADTEIEIEIFYRNNPYILGFRISKVYNIDNAYFQLNYIDKERFLLFEKSLEFNNVRLKNIIVISESKPIANIATKEPYMYKGQIISKISKGKGFEVLRNKIIRNNIDGKERIEKNISNVFGGTFIFEEKVRSNKEYIKLMVIKDGKETDILSQGSGFLQIVEIFSSLEYMDAKLHILLIDEPDSHIHSSLQRRLIEEIKKISNSQLFVISHNEKFIDEVEENEIIFINEEDKNKGRIKPLLKGSKRFVAEDLIGSLTEIEELRYADKIIFIEGDRDKKFLEDLWGKYRKITLDDDKKPFFISIKGVDDHITKLNAINSGYMDLVGEEIEWILLRDTDCIPMSKRNKFIKDAIKQISHEPISIIFQNGYELESVLISEKDKFGELIKSYYDIKDISLISFIENINNDYINAISNILSPEHGELKKSFERQQKERKDKIYKKISLKDFITEIDAENIQYIMTKRILDGYLLRIHEKILEKIDIGEKEPLTNETILDWYISNITKKEDFYTSHIELLDKIYGCNDIEDEVAITKED